MNNLNQLVSTIVYLYILILSSAGFSLAQEKSPAFDAQSEEDVSGPGFEVIPPTQGEAISILPLEDIPTTPQSDDPSEMPDDREERGEEGVSERDSDVESRDAATQPFPNQTISPVTETPGFVPLPDDTETFDPASLTSLLPDLQSASPEEELREALSYREVTVRALEKVTARTEDIIIPIGETVKFHSIDILLRTCEKRPPEEPPETTAFLEISEDRLDGETVNYFSGWMFASSPGLNGLEHPVYDVWVIDCKISEPVEPVGIE